MRCLLYDFQNNHDEELKNHKHYHLVNKGIYLPPTQKIDTLGAVMIVKLNFKVVDKKITVFSTSQTSRRGE